MGEWEKAWAYLFGCMEARPELLARLFLVPTFTNGDMDRMIDANDSLWQWRQVGYGRLKIIQSWEHRPTRKEWREMKRYIRTLIPVGIHVEFHGCPRVA